MKVYRLPPWLKQGIPDASVYNTANNIHKLKLNTVCLEAMCPNINDCFRVRQATFMILGRSCTRTCGFCNISGAQKLFRQASSDEPRRIIEAVKALELKYVVITSVTRDDLSDGGARQFVKTIESIRAYDESIKVEVLIPDFNGSLENLNSVVKAEPFVLAHNLETVSRLYSMIRPQADYERSLFLLKKAKEFSGTIITKSSLMLGLGEREEEVVATLKDLRGSDCDIVTLGQYLSPSSNHYPVKEFVPPEQFRKYEVIALGSGFKRVLSSPKARSSYHAEDLGTVLGDTLALA
jgi:lipoic acid synthetase